MNLKQQLMEDMKTAMKAKDTVKLGVIRFLRSAIKNHEIDHGEQDDQGITQIIAKQVKQIKESIEEYKKGNREDLVEQETAKLAILETYLPEQMSDEELEKIVQEVVSGLDNPQMGPVIGQVMGRVKGLADGKRVSEMVRKVLAS